MTRYALGIEYDGSNFHGWETQLNGCTVQACVEAALSRVAAHPIKTICAGRTDAGVHAISQVIHFDSPVARDPTAWTLGSNTHLPPTVRVLWAQQVPEHFHARFSARSRHYRYVMLNRPIRPALLSQQLSWEYRPLDVERMGIAAAYLLGRHDFSSFRASRCQARHAVRTLHRLDVDRQGEYVRLDVVANGFLHHMVRNIAGALMTIGAGERDPHWMQTVLDARDRSLGGKTASPNGLYFAGVEYPDEYAIPRVSPPQWV